MYTFCEQAVAERKTCSLLNPSEWMFENFEVGNVQKIVFVRSDVARLWSTCGDSLCGLFVEESGLFDLDRVGRWKKIEFVNENYCILDISLWIVSKIMISIRKCSWPIQFWTFFYLNWFVKSGSIRFIIVSIRVEIWNFKN